MKSQFVILLLFHFATSAQWLPTEGPSSRTIAEVYFEHDSIQYLSIRGCGIFTSNIQTKLWELQKTNWIDQYTLKGDSLFVSLREIRGGIVREDDMHYINLKQGLDGSIHINGINPTVLLHSDSCLYGTTGRNLFKLSFDGKELEYFKEGLPLEMGYNQSSGEFTYAPVLAVELAANLIYCGTKKGMYVSNSKNYQWNEINTGLRVGEVGVITAEGNDVYCSIENRIYKSQNAGDNWTLVYSTPSKINSIHLAEQYIYLGTEEGILSSGYDLTSWKPIDAGLTELHIDEVKTVGDELMCRTANSGIYSFESGEWQKNNQGTNCSIVRSLAESQGTIYALDWDGVHKLGNDEIWNSIEPDLPNRGFGSVAALNDKLFLSVAHDQDYLLYSSDQGENWEQMNGAVPFDGDDTYRLHVLGDTLYVVEDDKVFYTSDYGLNWADVSIPAEKCNYFNSRITFKSQLFAATCGDRELMKLENDNWVNKNFGLPFNFSVNKLIHNENLMLAILDHSTVARSCDEGNSWQVIGTFPELPDYMRDFASYNSIIFIASEQGIQYSPNKGETWHSYNEGLINSNIYSLLISGDNLYAGTAGNGVWTRTIDLEELPDSDDCYNIPIPADNDMIVVPNPSSSQVFISQDLIDAELNIFDAFGTSVLSRPALPVNMIETAHFPNGTYLVQVINSDTSITKKFLVAH